jgi:hypothetical protein
MSNLIKTIKATELKNNISISKDIFFDESSCILQPKSGCITFTFDQDANSCIIKFKRNSGNGIVFLSSGEHSKGFQVYSTSSQSIAYNLTDGKLQVNRTTRSRGDLSILEISLYSDSSDSLPRKPINQVSVLQSSKKRHQTVVPNVQKPILQENITNQYIQPLYIDLYNDQDSIKIESLKFASLIPETYKISNPLSVESTIKINTYKGMSWFCRVAPFIPNIKLSDNANVSISHIGDLIPANRMYIEEFSEDISSEEFKILNDAQLVVVSSNQNAILLKNNISPNKIFVSPKILPCINPVSIKHFGQDYILLENIKPDITDYLIESVKSLNQKIVLLNARGKYPEFVFPVNEYINYSNYIGIFKNAKCYINLPLKVEDNQSSEVELSSSLGTPIITSSWAYMDNPDILFLNMHNKLGDYLVPEPNDLQELIKYSSKKEVDINNNKFEDFINILFG